MWKLYSPFLVDIFQLLDKFSHCTIRFPMIWDGFSCNNPIDLTLLISSNQFFQNLLFHHFYRKVSQFVLSICSKQYSPDKYQRQSELNFAQKKYLKNRRGLNKHQIL